MKQHIMKVCSSILALCCCTAGLPVIAGPAGTALRGDTNGDGAIGIEDAQSTLVAYVNILSGTPHGLSDAAFSAADIDADGEISAQDAQWILMYYVANNVAGNQMTWEQIINSGKSNDNTIPDSGDQLTILCWTGDDIEKMISQFTQANPQYAGKVQYMNVGSSGGDSREMYANYFAGGLDADLYVVEDDWALEYLNQDEYSAPICDLGFTEQDFANCYPYTLSCGRDTNGVLKAVTWQATPGGYVYRADLAEQYLGVTTPAEMQNYVKNWDAFAKTAETVWQASRGKTAMAATVAGLWRAWLCDYRGPYVDAKNVPAADTLFSEYANYARMCWDKGYVTPADQWTDQWYDIGQDNSTLGYFYCTWCLGKGSMLSNAEGGDKGATYGKYRITEGPAAWNWGGSWLALSPKCDNRSIAHDFIKYFVVDADTMRSYAESTETFVNNTKVNEQLAADPGNGNVLLGGQNPIGVLHNNAKKQNAEMQRSYYDAAVKNAIEEVAYNYAKGCYKSEESACSSYHQKAESWITGFQLPDPNTSTTTYQPPVPYNNGDQLSILCWTGDDIEKMIEQFTDYNPQYADKVQYVNVGSSGGEAREMYANYFAGGEDADLYVVDGDWMLDYLNHDDYAAPICDLGFTEQDFANCYPYTLSCGRDSNGVLKAVTWQATPGGYVYRADLAEKYLGVTTPAEMQKYVKDWDTFAKTAESVRQASSGKTALADTFGGIWQVRSCSAPRLVSDDHRLNIDSFFTQVADTLRTYSDQGYVTSAEQWSDSWYTIGQNDSTMGYFYCTWCLGKGSMLYNSEGGNKGATYGKYRITEGPAAWNWGGSWLALSPKCDNSSIAHDFIKHFVVDADTMRSYAEFKNEFVNNSRVMEQLASDPKNGNEYLGGQNPISVLHQNALSLDREGKTTPYDSQILDAVYTYAYRYAKKEYADSAAALNACKKDLQVYYE